MDIYRYIQRGREREIDIGRRNKTKEWSVHRVTANKSLTAVARAFYSMSEKRKYNAKTTHMFHRHVGTGRILKLSEYCF